MIFDLEAMSGREAFLPSEEKRSILIVGDEIIVSVVGEQDDVPISVFRDTVAVFHWIAGTIKHAPVAIRAISEGALTEYFAIARFVGFLETH
jgi:hypothetical protein